MPHTRQHKKQKQENRRKKMQKMSNYYEYEYNNDDNDIADYPYEKRFYKACKYGDEHIVRIILKEGVDVNTSDGFWGYTPLSVACSYGHENVVRILLMHGADVKRSSPLSKICAWYTKCHTSVRENIVQLLLQHGADVTDMRIYAHCEVGETVYRCLIDYGVDVKFDTRRQTDKEKELMYRLIEYANTKHIVPILK